MLSINNLTSGILQSVSMDVQSNERIAIMGRSGSGKTTLLRCIAGFQSYTGTITFNDTPIDALSPAKRSFGYVEQHNTLLPHLTALQNIALPLTLRKLHNKAEAKQRALQLMQELELDHLVKQFPGTLSGGEQQRVQLARSLIYSPRVLLLDEPFRSLDAYTRNDVLQWLSPILTKEAITTILVTHDSTEANALAERTVQITELH